MDGSQILKAAAFHSSFLMHTGVVSARADEDLLGPTLQEALAHSFYMVSQVPLFVEQVRTNKAERWTSFVQGALWDRGLIKTRVLKEVMMPQGSTYDRSA